MIKHEFNKQSGILHLTLVGPLEKGDFAIITSEIDPYINKNGKIHGILISASDFPFWKDFSGMVSHFKFVRDHHRKIEKIAIVTDDLLASVMPGIAQHFVKAQIKNFKTQDMSKAEAWITEGSHLVAS